MMEHHILDFDVIQSQCCDCVYRQQDNCQDITGNCPQEIE